MPNHQFHADTDTLWCDSRSVWAFDGTYLQHGVCPCYGSYCVAVSLPQHLPGPLTYNIRLQTLLPPFTSGEGISPGAKTANHSSESSRTCGFWLICYVYTKSSLDWQGLWTLCTLTSSLVGAPCHLKSLSVAAPAPVATCMPQFKLLRKKETGSQITPTLKEWASALQGARAEGQHRASPTRAAAPEAPPRPRRK